MKLMFDLQVLALADRHDARHLVQDRPRRAEPRVPGERIEPAVPPGVAPRRPRRRAIMEFNKICKYRVGQMAYLLDKLKTTMDGDKNLLDKTLVIWGSPMADPNVHNHRRCPLVLFGHANGVLKGSLHLKAADGTPMANAMLTLLHGSAGRHQDVRRQHGRVLAARRPRPTTAAALKRRVVAAVTLHDSSFGFVMRSTSIAASCRSVLTLRRARSRRHRRVADAAHARRSRRGARAAQAGRRRQRRRRATA